MRFLYTVLAGFFPPRVESCAEIDAGRRVRVQGEVVARDLIESTLTGERCVYYQYTVEEFRRSSSVGLGDGHWRLIERDEAIAEFYLVSGGARVIVSPAHAKVSRGRSIPVQAIDLGGIHDRRAQEMRIGPGDIIEIYGVAETAHDIYDEGRDYRAPLDRLMLTAPPGDHLRIRLVRRARNRRRDSAAG
ncbi:MAG: hypothetical protein KJO07_11690 [Deltaproteobacteria bacterium]|nr:hypothetical protein [Deltaproteobacteria bacterium]